MPTLGSGVWRETFKTWKIRNEHCRTWNMVRKLKNVENETQILFDQESDFNYSKTWKMRNAHWWTWIMVRKLKNVGNETQIMYDLAYGKKHSKTWNMRNHTEGPGVWQEK